MSGAGIVLLAVGAAAGCAEVLGLDEPTVRDESATGSTGTGGGDATTSTSTSSGGSTGTEAATTTSSSGAGGQGGEGGQGGGAGGAPPTPCRADGECDDANDCTTDSCGEDGICVREPIPDAPLGADDPFDCIDRACLGGVETITPDDAEDPPDPVPICDTVVCSNGRPQSVIAEEGESCGVEPLVCDGEGNCAGCTLDADCGAATECSNPTCDVGTGLCNPGYIVTNLPDVVDGDCHRPRCTGDSAVAASIVDDSDYPSPLPTCTRTCLNGALRNGIEGTACNNGGGAQGVCSGDAMGDDACRLCREMPGNPDPGCGSGLHCDETLDGGEGGCVGCLISDHCIGNIAGPICRANGQCGCTLDSQCASSAAGTQCTAGQYCGCENDGDCSASPRGDSCNFGFCGCDSSADCEGLNGSRCMDDTDICGCASDGDCAVGYFCDSPPTCSF